MGVPVVTLAGDRHAGRVGVSLLTRLGLQELIAGDEDDYISISKELAGNPDRLSMLRETMRVRIRKSNLCDAGLFAKSMEAAYREMWEKWCSISA